MSDGAEGKEERNSPDVGGVTAALDALGEHDAELARQLSALLILVADEASRSGRFARALRSALAEQQPARRDQGPGDGSPRSSRRSPTGTRARNRRPAGVLDPFALYADSGEGLLRERLAELDIELLRDIVAEHGMDTDRLAMKWKDPQRVIDRIVDRVSARSAKGSAFRSERSGVDPT